MFDPNLFLNSSIDTTLSDKRVLVPEGEYLGIILADKMTAKEITTDKGTFTMASLMIEVVDSDGKVEAATHRDKNIVRHEFFLDLNESGGLDLREGMNVPLGQLRTATGQNNPGQSWAPSMLGGQMIRFQLKHKLDKDGEPRERVTSVGKPS